MSTGLTGVAATAVGVARIRAAESARVDALFDDPLARRLVDAVGPGDADEHPLAAMLRVQVVARTVFYDGWLRDAVASGCRQVVIVAAGLDARAFRLDLPAEVTVWEIDRPDVLATKQRLIDAATAAPSCRRVVVAADLGGTWQEPLRSSGHDAGEPSAWLVEGLLVYLDADTAAGLLDRIDSHSPAGSRIATEAARERRPAALDGIAESPRMERLTALWRGGLGVPVEGWLTDRGWTARRTDLGEVAAGIGRPLDTGYAGGGFVTAVRG